MLCPWALLLLFTQGCWSGSYLCLLSKWLYQLIIYESIPISMQISSYHAVGYFCQIVRASSSCCPFSLLHSQARLCPPSCSSIFVDSLKLGFPFQCLRPAPDKGNPHVSPFYPPAAVVQGPPNWATCFLTQTPKLSFTTWFSPSHSFA